MLDSLLWLLFYSFAFYFVNTLQGRAIWEKKILTEKWASLDWLTCKPAVEIFCLSNK